MCFGAPPDDDSDDSEETRECCGNRKYLFTRTDDGGVRTEHQGKFGLEFHIDNIFRQVY